jgi:NitT/TauT family transport system substrate-binding protein
VQRPLALAARFTCLLVVLLTACSAPTAPPQTVSLKVVTLPFIAFAPYYLGVEDGYFAEQNLQVELVEMTTQPDTLPALVSGQVDVTSGQVSAGMFNVVAQGANVRLVSDKGYIDPQSCSNLALVARQELVPPDGRVTADGLRGKRLMVVRGTWNDYYAERLLQPLGLGVDDFNVVNVPSPAQPEAMAKGQMDMVVQNEPWVTRLTQAGHRTIMTSSAESLPLSQSAVMLFGPRLIGPNANVGERFMTAYLKAVRAYNQGKTPHNVEVLAKYTQLDQGLLRAMCWPTLRADGSVNVESVLDFQTWAVGKGIVDKFVPAEKFLDTSFATRATQRLDSGSR